MSTLQVANIHFSSGGTTRIDQVGSTVNIISPSTNVSGNLVTTGAVTAANVVVGNTNVSLFDSGYKNKIINGNFDIWQRGTSNGMSGYYTADRWSSLNAGTTKTASQQSFTVGQTSVPGEPRYFMRHVVTSSAGAGNYSVLVQRVESVRTLAGKTVTLSFWAKADTSKNIAVDMEQYFGSGGSPSATVSGIGVTTYALTSSWQKFTTTFSVPSISGKTLGSNNDDLLGLWIWFDAGSSNNSRTNSLGQQSGTFDIAQVQLEEGPAATAFEQRHISQELALCQRYYCATYLNVRGTADVGLRYFENAIYWPVQMRTTTTTTLNTTGGVNGNFSVSSPNSIAARAIAESVAVGDVRLLMAPVTADAEL